MGINNLKFSSEFPSDQFEMMFDNSYLTGGSFNGTILRTQCQCENANYRAFFEFENYNDIVYFVIFEIRNGGKVWQLSSYSLDLDGTIPAYVPFTIARAATVSLKRLQSGANSESDVLLWGTELPKLGINPVIFDMETENLIRPEAEHAPVMLNSSRYSWVATNRNYHDPSDFYEPTLVTLSHHVRRSPHHLNWYSGRPMHK